MRNKPSLRWMIPLALVCSMVSMIILLSYWHYAVEYESLLERSQLKGRIAMDAFAGLVEAGLMNHEEKALGLALKSVSQFPCFSRALGIDNTGRVFFSSAGEGGLSLEKAGKDVVSHVPRSGESLLRMGRGDALVEVFHRVSIPSLDEAGSSMAGGWLYLELDIRQDLKKNQETILMQSVVASGVVVAISFLLWLWLSRRLTQPLMRLAGVVGTGSVDPKAMCLQEENFCSELDELTKGFALLGNELASHYASLNRQRMLYQALSRTNQAILHSRDEKGVLTDVCEAVVSAGIDLVWIGYIDKPSDALSIVHTAGAHTGWLNTVRRHIGFDQDPLVCMVKQGIEGAVLIDEEHCKENVWYAEARLNGFSMGASFPISRDKTVVGGLVVMSSDVNLLDNDGKLLLREMAADIGFALSNFDRDSLRLRMESNLAHERGLLRALVDTIPDIIFFKDKANIYLGCNEAFEAIIAMDESQLIGGTDRDFFPSPIATKFTDQDERILASGIEERNEVCLDKPDGSRVYLDLLKAPFRDTNGGVEGLVGIGRDISSEMQVRRELQQALQVLKQAERISNIGSWSFDPETRVMHWSELMYRLLGYDDESLVPGVDRLIERCHPQDRESLQQALDKLLKGEIEAITQSYRLQLADGDVRYLIGRASYSTLKDQQHSRIIGTVQDVTRERTSDQEQKLTLDSVRAQQRQALIGNLTADALHELNDIMTPILGFAQLAGERDSCSADTMRGYLKLISEAATRGGRLLSKLTAISQARIHRRSELCDLLMLSREIVGLLEAVLPATIHTKTQFSDDLPKVQIDATDYKQIVLTLALRAKDAIAGEGELRLSIRSKEFEASSGPISHVEVCVEGFREALPEAMKVQPGRDIVTMHEEGGLRHEIVSMLIKLYGGVLEVDRIPGQLERFRLLLPASASQDSVSDGAELPMLPDKALGAGRRVLVVDDEASVTLYIQEYLQWLGFEVEVFAESRQALEYFLRDPGAFDLLVTDQVMPGLDGLHLIASVHELRKDLPVILCSGYSESVDLTNTEDYDISVFLRKPVSLEELLQAVERCLLPHVE
jgi:PAS domain S-box-containing protein